MSALPHEIVRPAKRKHSPKTIYIVIPVILIAVLMAAIPAIRHERLRLLVLRNLVEEAAAPDEPVLTDSWLLYRFLYWKGSPALREQLHQQSSLSPLPPNQEILVVAPEGSPLWNALRSNGYLLSLDAAQTRWLASGDALTIPGRGPIAIQFAVPPIQPE